MLEERLGPYILGSGFHSHKEVVTRLWLFRGIVILVFLLATSSSVVGIGDVTTPVIYTGLAILLLIIEYLFKDYLPASIKNQLYAQGIIVYPSFRKYLLGFNGFIPKEDVASLRIIRGQIYQRTNDLRLMKWTNAPIKYVIVTSKGGRYSSGLKPPGQVIAMTEAISLNWKVPIIDKGDGLGQLYEYVDGKMELVQ